MKPLRVLFFGDSICVGQHVSIHAGWVTGVSAKLAQLGAKLGRDIVVVNASGNGRTTREALERMPYEVQSQEPDIVIVQFGMNDCNHWASDRGVPRVSAKSFMANLEEIVVRARASGASTVFLNTNHPTGLTDRILTGTTNSYQDNNAHYNQLIRQAAAEMGDTVVLNDVEQVFTQHIANHPDNLDALILPAPDLLHLSVEGHQLYLDVTYPVVEAAVLALLDG